MEYRILGGTGVRVSHFCLGAMMFGPTGNADHTACIKMTHAALDAGVNFIDTSDTYSEGESERILAKALKGRREQVVLATKCFFPPGRAGLFTRSGKNVTDGGGSRRWIMRAIEESLRRLETDYIDVYQLHRWDWGMDVEESIAAMTDLQRAGKIRVIVRPQHPPNGLSKRSASRSSVISPVYVASNVSTQSSVAKLKKPYCRRANVMVSESWFMRRWLGDG